MVGLIGAGVLNDLLIPAYVLFCVSIPFFVTYVRNTKQWWPLIPGGITAVIGLAFLVAEAAFEYIGALVLVLVGAVLLVRVFTRKEPAGDVGPTEAESGPSEDDTAPPELE